MLSLLDGVSGHRELYQSLDKSTFYLFINLNTHLIWTPLKGHLFCVFKSHNFS